MTEKNSKSFADESMLELFRMEVEQQASVLTEGLLKLEQDPAALTNIEPLMRAAHSIKGAARLVGIMDAVGLAHKMEDCLVAAQKGKLVLSSDDADLLLKSVDMLSAIALLTRDEDMNLSTAQKAECAGLEASLRLEENPDAPERIEPLMRAAHSIKGAARLGGIHIAVDIAHRMEDCLVAAQTGKLSLAAEDIDVLLKGNDLLSTIAQLTENVDAVFSAEQQVAYDHLLDALADVLAGRKPAKMSVIAAAPATAPHNDAGEEAEPAAAAAEE